MFCNKFFIIFLLAVMIYTQIPANAEEYKLQPDDVIKVSVWGYPDMEKIVAISPDGTITFPPIKDLIKVSDLTVKDAGEEILNKLKKYMGDASSVQVTVMEFRGKKIFILGQVARPGKYTFPVMPNVLEAITQAGGSIGMAALKSVRILRGDMKKPEVILADIEKFLATGDSNLLPQIEPGDTIYVPFLGEEGTLLTSEIYILGQVARPGKYTFPVMPNVLEAITQAGGGLGQASLRAVRILRGDMKKPEIIVANVEKFLETGDPKFIPQIKPGDTIYVPVLGDEGDLVTREEKTKNIINIIGEVRGPGIYPLTDPVPLLQAILMSGGPTFTAELSKIKIIRNDQKDGNIKEYTIKEYDFNKYLDNADLNNNPMIYAGDTIVVSKYIYEGITQDREEPKSDIVYVLGEAVRPGTYQLKYKTNLWHTLQIAGGPTSEAQINEIKIVKGYGNTGYPKTLIVNINDYMEKSDFRDLPQLQNGDTVILPKKSHFWRETVKFFSEIAIILGVVNMISK